MLATKARADFARSPIFGCMLFTRAGRSSCACDHIACTFSPITGHPATDSGGAGITSSLLCTSLTNRWTESPSELINIAVGTTINAMPRITSTVAERPCLPPIFAATNSCSG